VDCSNCGQKLPDGARFCSRCGAPTGEPPLQPGEFAHVRPAEPAGYEVCEIDYWRGYLKCDFFARSVATDGVTEVARSPLFRWFRNTPPPRDGKALAAHTVLVQRLIDAGWEPAGASGTWYAQRFRRAIFGDPAGAPFSAPARSRDVTVEDWPATGASPETGG
jgi:hypothetical protein